MDLETALQQIDIELNEDRERAAIRTLLLQSGIEPTETLIDAFIAVVRAGLNVSRSMAVLSQPGNANRPLQHYASEVCGLWVDPRGNARAELDGQAKVENAYIAMRSFLAVAPARSQAERATTERAKRSLKLAGQFLGAEFISRIDEGARSTLRGLRLDESTTSALFKYGAGAWGAIAKVPMPQEPKVAFRSVKKAAVPPVQSELKPAGEDARLYEVWFGTNRACIDVEAPRKGFRNERDTEGKVHYGTCMVEVPRSHRFGSTGTSFYKRWLRLEFKDDHLKLRTIKPIGDEDSFIEEMRSELEAQPEKDRVALVYLHGYNTSFEEAAIRAAQIGVDLKVTGVTAFYSWPSMAAAKGYPADIARVEASEAQIAEFLSAIATRSGAKVVHVLAHSMGNRGFARAVSRITSVAASAGTVRFGQILLAAPDIDVDLFKALAVAYPRIAKRTTMYVSAKDRALEMSSWLQDSNRAGFTPPVTVVDGIETIEVSAIDLTMLGHGYYAEAEAVLYDMKQLLDSDDPTVPPERRPRIEKRERGGLTYWAMGA
jgi:esterase/lipase superfamily enzyme